MPEKSVTQEPTTRVSTKDSIDTPENVFSWSSDAEAQGSNEEQRKYSPFGSGKIKSEGHTRTHSRGQGQPHHRGRGGGRGLKAPPSHSNPDNYLLNRPWRRGNAAGEGSSPSSQPVKVHETWRKTESSDGTRKVVSVQKSESVHDRSDGKLVEKGSVMGGEGGVALAKQAGTGEAATSSPKAGDI